MEHGKLQSLKPKCFAYIFVFSISGIIDSFNFKKQKKKYFLFYTFNTENSKTTIHKNGITTPEEAEVLKQQLFNLEINGQTFKEIYENLEKIKKDYSYREINVKPIHWRNRETRSNVEPSRIRHFIRNIVGNISSNNIH